MVEPSGHCPYLGLKQNQAIRFASPTTEHRCYVSGQGQEIPVRQGEYCLSPGHINCPLYIGLSLPSTPSSRHRVEALPALPPAGLGSWVQSLSPRDRTIYALLVGLGVIVLSIYTFLAIGWWAGGAQQEPQAPPALVETNSPTPSQETSPTPTPSPSTTPSPSATASPSITPTPSLTPTPSATPTSLVIIIPIEVTVSPITVPVPFPVTVTPAPPTETATEVPIEPTSDLPPTEVPVEPTAEVPTEAPVEPTSEPPPPEVPTEAPIEPTSEPPPPPDPPIEPPLPPDPEE